MEKVERTEGQKIPEYIVYTSTWREVDLDIRHCQSWCRRDDDFVTQHIEVRSWNKRLLPITETGYRSHFMNGAKALAEFENDPVAFVLWWLDEAAKDPNWKRKEVDDRQGSLF